MGFSNVIGTSDVYYYPEGSGNASLVNLTQKDSVRRFQCKFDSLDNFCQPDLDSLDFIKCDVEGAELLVFKGGINTIKKHKPIIFSEILRKWSSQFNYNPNEIFELFASLGYHAYTIQSGKLVLFTKMNEKTTNTNFVFLHAQKHRLLIDQLVINY